MATDTFPQMSEQAGLNEFLYTAVEFLDFVVEEYADSETYSLFSLDLHDAIQAAWRDLQRQEVSHALQVIAESAMPHAAAFGLEGDQFALKVAITRQALFEFATIHEGVAHDKKEGKHGAFRFYIRKAFGKVVEAIDVVLDSALSAVTLIPPANVIAHGLKEFKDVIVIAGTD